MSLTHVNALIKTNIFVHVTSGCPKSPTTSSLVSHHDINNYYVMGWINFV